MKNEPAHFVLDYEDTLLFYERSLMAASEKGDVEFNNVRRDLGQNDLFFMMVFILGLTFAMHPWIFARCREVQREPDGCLDLWAREHFKAVDLNEPVPTPVGWKKHGELNIGDWVFGADGNPTQVVAKTDVFTNADCYRVTFDDNYSVVVSGDHLWTVEQKTRKRLGKGRVYRESVTISTREMSLRDHIPDNRMSIPVAPPVFQIPHILPIDPYTLGAWLGDGASASPRITCAYSDIEIIKNIMSSGIKAIERKSSNKNTGLFQLGDGVKGKKGTGLVPILRELGVLNNKHIPRSYMFSHESHRRALLQGLMDTDGTVNDRGTATFVNKNKRLANEVFDLCASLGLKPRFNIYQQHHGDVFYVSFQAYKHDAPFRLKRKLDKCKDGNRKARRFIVAVDPVETIPVSCIQVAAKDGLYLIGRNYVTTHNSTVITFAMTIFEIINNPEITIGIFSHTKGIARKFLIQIKQELERNDSLKALWPDIFYQNPARESLKWSEEGICVNRQGNPKECTVEAWGLVDGQPTSKHYDLRVYDDVVTIESVSTPAQIEKTTTAWQMSDNLGKEGGRERYIGTRYHLFDTYSDMIEQQVVKVRLHPATKDGTEYGEPVLMSKETLLKKRQVQGQYVFSSQMLLDPVADKAMGFNRQWLVHDDVEYNIAMKKLWRFIIVDPAGGKQRKNNDYSTFFVIGVGADNKYRVLDIRRDRMSLTKRAETLLELHKHWKPSLVAYEEYGMQADIEHIKFVQKLEMYEFDIVTLGGSMKKELRILGLVPYFENGFVPISQGGDGLPKSRIIFPTSCKVMDYQGINRDLVKDFVEEEFVAFPVLAHDDMLDCLARVQDLERDGLIQLPKEDAAQASAVEKRLLSAYKQKMGTGSWTTA